MSDETKSQEPLEPEERIDEAHKKTEINKGLLSEYYSPANLLTLISIILSLVAFLTSLKSCQVSQDANELARRQYREERLLVLQGEFNEQSDEVKLKSSEDSITFLEGAAYFPKVISEQEWKIRPLDKTLYLSSAKIGLKEFLKLKIPKKEGYAQVILDGKIPILIDSYYTSKGSSYLDRSLYSLSYEFVQSDKSNDPSIRYTGLIFMKRFPQDGWETKEILDEIINGDRNVYIQPKSPNN